MYIYTPKSYVVHIESHAAAAIHVLSAFQCLGVADTCGHHATLTLLKLIGLRSWRIHYASMFLPLKFIFCVYFETNRSNNISKCKTNDFVIWCKFISLCTRNFMNREMFHWKFGGRIFSALDADSVYVNYIHTSTCTAFFAAVALAAVAFGFACCVRTIVRIYTFNTYTRLMRSKRTRRGKAELCIRCVLTTSYRQMPRHFYYYTHA